MLLQNLIYHWQQACLNLYMDFLNLHTSETLRVVSHKSICGKDKLKFKSFFVIELKGRESCTEFFGIEPR